MNWKSLEGIGFYLTEIYGISSGAEPVKAPLEQILHENCNVYLSRYTKPISELYGQRLYNVEFASRDWEKHKFDKGVRRPPPKTQPDSSKSRAVRPGRPLGHFLGYAVAEADSRRGPGFEPESGHITFVVDKARTELIPPRTWVTPVNDSPIVRGWCNRPFSCPSYSGLVLSPTKKIKKTHYQLRRRH
jgi:hypothetical protein